MLERFMTVASFAISVGGLCSVFTLKDRKKEFVLSVVVTFLVATSGVLLYQHYKQEHLIAQVQSEIFDTLSNRTLTFDQLYHELHFRPFPVVDEALFRAVEKKAIGHRVITFQKDGKILTVRCYFVQ